MDEKITSLTKSLRARGFKDDAGKAEDTSGEYSEDLPLSPEQLLQVGANARLNKSNLATTYKADWALLYYDLIYPVIRDNFNKSDDVWNSTFKTQVAVLNSNIKKQDPNNKLNALFPDQVLDVYRSNYLEKFTKIGRFSKDSQDWIKAAEAFMKLCQNFLQEFESFGIPYKELFGEENRKIITDLMIDMNRVGHPKEEFEPVLYLLHGPYVWDTQSVKFAAELIAEILKKIAHGQRDISATEFQAARTALTSMKAQLRDNEYDDHKLGILNEGLESLNSDNLLMQQRAFTAALSALAYLAVKCHELRQGADELGKAIKLEPPNWPLALVDLDTPDHRMSDDSNQVPANEPTNAATDKSSVKDGGYIGGVIESGVDASTGKTPVGRLLKVRPAGQNRYRALVNTGTELQPLMKVFPGGDFGNACEQFESDNNLMSGPAEGILARGKAKSGEHKGNPRTYNDVKGVNCVVSDRIEDHLPGTKVARKAATYVEVVWKDGTTNWLTLSEFRGLLGERFADASYFRPALKKYIENDIFFIECRIKGIHPDTEASLTAQDKVDTPWLFDKPADSILLETRKRHLAAL